MKFPFKYMLGIAAASIVLATAGELSAPHRNGPKEADAPTLPPAIALIHWDSGWYGDISEHGYWYKPGEQSPVAFFPVYPLVIRGLTGLVLNRWYAGEMVSLFSGMLALYLFFLWVKKLAPAHAHWALWTLALYPFANYLYGVVYSDSLFLLLVVAAFLSLEHRRYFLCTLLGIAATACRPVAPAVVVGLLVRSLELRKKEGGRLRLIDFLPALSGVGLAAYMAYLQINFDDALAFIHVQSAPGWAQPPGWRSWLKVVWFQTLFPRCSFATAFRLGGHALCTFLALGLSWPTAKKVGWGYGVYCALVVGIPAISSKDFQGLGRYVMAAFPLFLTASLLLAENRPVHKKLLLVSTAILAICAVSFGAGSYIA
jgi:hypothetical protein